MDNLLGLSRQQWAMAMAALIVVVIFILSARRKPVKSQTDMQALGRMVTILLPDGTPQAQLRLLSTIASAASGATERSQAPALVGPKSDHSTTEIRAIPDDHLEAESEGAKSNGHTTF